MDIQNYAIIISLFSTFISLSTLIFLVFQLKQHRIFKKAEFVNSLDDELNKYKDTITEFYPEGKYYESKVKIPENKFPDVGFLISFFEKLKHLLDTKIIDIQTIDKMFGYRFFP